MRMCSGYTRLLKVLDEAFQHFPGADAQVVEHLSSKATKQLHAASWAIQRVFRNQHTYVMIEKALVVAETCKEEKIKSLAATRLQYFWRYALAQCVFDIPHGCFVWRA